MFRVDGHAQQGIDQGDRIGTRSLALRIVRRDHANHKSPNSAWSEAAAAGALHIQLGGTHLYFGKPVEKPTIGDDDRPAEEEDIRRVNSLLYVTSFLMILITAAVGLLA